MLIKHEYPILERDTEKTAVIMPDSLLLQWTPGQDEDLRGYNIYLSDNEKAVKSSIIAANSSIYSYNQLVNGVKEYCFSIEAVDYNGNKSMPVETIFTFEKPALIEEINGIVNKLDVTLNWSRSESY